MLGVFTEPDVESKEKKSQRIGIKRRCRRHTVECVD